MGRIAAPIPIAGSISNTSVTLEWKWNSTGLGWLHMNHAINVSIKWCHSQPEMCSTWEAVPNATGRSGQSLVTVNELRPYTIYRVSKSCHHYAVGQSAFVSSMVTPFALCSMSSSIQYDTERLAS